MLYVHVSEGPSPIAGKGVFLREAVGKGSKILKFDGPIISWEQSVAIGRQDHVVPVGDDQYVDIYEPEASVNHSCDPSTGFSDEATLIALRDLSPGDEVTFDYSLVTADGWTMECHCGSTTCRGTVTDYKDLPESVKGKYRGLTPPWIIGLGDTSSR